MCVRAVLVAALGGVTAIAGATPPADSSEQTVAGDLAQQRATNWASLLTAQDLARELASPTPPLVIDVRSEDKYLAGHIPGAINVPGSNWRTPKAEPGTGVGNTVFRTPAGLPDFQRYERLLGEAGVTRRDNIVIVGNFAGKSDSTVPVVLLGWLGVERVRYLDGVAVDEWTNAGYTLSTTPRRLEPAIFIASPRSGVIWTIDDVLGNIGSSEVVFWDCRTEEEWVGKDLRGNKRGGRIPGAVWLDSQSLLDRYTNKSIGREELLARLAERGITPDKIIVIYCQTGTRCTLPVIQLQDLGFNRVALYDGSWTEYGNRDDTPVETEG